MTKILAIDDSSLSRRRFVAKPLRDAGYEVIEAENGKVGLEAARKHSPDCIISDLLMPEMDGFEFLEAMQKENSQIPIIVASADIQESSRQKVFDLGATEFLNKPFRPEQLLEKVAAVLETVTEGA